MRICAQLLVMSLAAAVVASPANPVGRWRVEPYDGMQPDMITKYVLHEDHTYEMLIGGLVNLPNGKSIPMQEKAVVGGTWKLVKGKLRIITDGETNDSAPSLGRFSADGKQIVFPRRADHSAPKYVWTRIR